MIFLKMIHYLNLRVSKINNKKINSAPPKYIYIYIYIYIYEGELGVFERELSFMSCLQEKAT
jgi:hypothetical protein